MPVCPRHMLCAILRYKAIWRLSNDGECQPSESERQSSTMLVLQYVCCLVRQAGTLRKAVMKKHGESARQASAGRRSVGFGVMP